MSACWSMRKNRAAPSTIFSQSQMSPRQIANKVFTLGCKKLDRDSRRSKPLYDTRIRVLINNQIQKAEEALNKRTRRTNRRVMAAEEDDIDLALPTFEEHRHHQTTAEKSPLRTLDAENEDDSDSNSGNGTSVEEERISFLSPQNAVEQATNNTFSTLSSDPRFFPRSSGPLKQNNPSSTVLARDCRPVELSPPLQKNTSARIESIM
ncbi:hypothetical protein BX666DRAFT_1880637 [Dichotomocladium elegans]|nr:hypothetical protein BX666DRAFT_1880637 [Dichotomocladium elegans]